MAKIQVVIVDPTGSEGDADLPDNVAVSQLIPEIVRAIPNMSGTDYSMFNKSQNFQYGPTDTLASKNTAAGDRLLVLTSADAGGR